MASSREETLKSALFGKEAIRFEIPKYQRAYSWERDQWKQFLQDLKDAESGYYLGHYLFEAHDDVYFVNWVADKITRISTAHFASL